MKKILKQAMRHILSGEKMRASVCGVYECKLMGRPYVRKGILLATDKRIIFFAKKLFGYDIETYPLEKITSITASKGFMGHSITFISSGNQATLKWIVDGRPEVFLAKVQSGMEQLGKSAAVGI